LPDKGAQTSDAVGGPIIIFPDPTELKRDDGMVEFRATAYGRSTLNFNITQSDVRGEFYKTLTTLEASEAYRIPSLNRQYVVRGVLLTAQGLAAATVAPPGLPIIVRPGQPPPGFGPASGVVAGYGPPLVPGVTNFESFQIEITSGIEDTYQRNISINTFLILQNLESTNFGAYTEFAATWISGGRVDDSVNFVSSSVTT
jgi:hypothetical protein